MNSQKAFITKVKAALGQTGRDDRRRTEVFGENDSIRQKQIIQKIQARTDEERRTLLATLAEIGKPLNMKVLPVTDAAAAADAVSRLIQEKNPEWGGAKSVIAWQHPLIEQMNLPQVLAAQNVTVYHTTAGTERTSQNLKSEIELIRRHTAESFVGVTSADYCLAQTATLVLRTRPDQARAASLLPSIHVAVIELGQIIADLQELYVLLKQDPGEKADGLTNCMTFITGPSKTADIELTMIHGAHGPRELYLYVIDL
jgi:L-lactate dehydrogenase complex protein LldG